MQDGPAPVETQMGNRGAVSEPRVEMSAPSAERHPMKNATPLIEDPGGDKQINALLKQIGLPSSSASTPARSPIADRVPAVAVEAKKSWIVRIFEWFSNLPIIRWFFGKK